MRDTGNEELSQEDIQKQHFAGGGFDLILQGLPALVKDSPKELTLGLMLLWEHPLILKVSFEVGRGEAQSLTRCQQQARLRRKRPILQHTVHPIKADGSENVKPPSELWACQQPMRRARESASHLDPCQLRHCSFACADSLPQCQDGVNHVVQIVRGRILELVMRCTINLNICSISAGDVAVQLQYVPMTDAAFQACSSFPLQAGTKAVAVC